MGKKRLAYNLILNAHLKSNNKKLHFSTINYTSFCTYLRELQKCMINPPPPNTKIRVTLIMDHMHPHNEFVTHSIWNMTNFTITIFYSFSSAFHKTHVLKAISSCQGAISIYFFLRKQE